MRVPQSSSVVSLAAMIAMASGCAQQARFTHSADVRAAHVGSSPIEARTENGSITLTKADVAQVEVHADIRAVTQERADATVVSTERTGDGTLLITVRWPEGKRQSNEACSLDIKVPDATGVRLFTSNGDIDARGLGGAATLKTSNGTIVVTDHAGSVDADSSNGDITLTGIDGAAAARTSNGGIDLRGVKGAVKADTSNGGIKIALGGPGPVDAESSNGSIRLDVGFQFSGEVEIETSNGSIDLSSAGGSKIVTKTKDRALLQFGGGGTRSTLETSNGSVTVKGVEW
jgi:hypothetical protein